MQIREHAVTDMECVQILKTKQTENRLAHRMHSREWVRESEKESERTKERQTESKKERQTDRLKERGSWWKEGGSCLSSGT